MNDGDSEYNNRHCLVRQREPDRSLIDKRHDADPGLQGHRDRKRVFEALIVISAAPESPDR